MTNEYEMMCRLSPLGIAPRDACALRRIAMTLHRWHELECGIDSGCVERDEDTGKTYWLNSLSGKSLSDARPRDRRAGAAQDDHGPVSDTLGLCARRPARRRALHPAPR